VVSGFSVAFIRSMNGDIVPKRGAEPMSDFLMLALLVAAFAIAGAYIPGCDYITRLSG
jgi:hypothetical protein